jgi:hypothetical protein
LTILSVRSGAQFGSESGFPGMAQTLLAPRSRATTTRPADPYGVGTLASTLQVNRSSAATSPVLTERTTTAAVP